jgi:hypothetical protein
MNDERCETCRFYRLPTRECRRFPKLQVVSGTWRHSAMQPDDWCGEWQRDHDRMGPVQVVRP